MIADLEFKDFDPKDLATVRRAFELKTPLPASVFDTLEARAKSAAFTLARLEAMKDIMQARKLLARVLDGSMTFREAMLGLQSQLAEGDFSKQTLARLRLVIHQNVAQAQAVASSIAKALGLKDDAGETEVVAAIASLKDGTVPKSELIKLNDRLQELERTNADLLTARVETEANALIEKFSHEGKLTGSTAKLHLERLTADPKTFDKAKADFVALMAASPVIIPQGQTVPPDGEAPDDRETIINNAAAEYDADNALGQPRLTSRESFIDMRLRDSGQAGLTDQERAQFTIVRA